jgi:hypothetical protein
MSGFLFDTNLFSERCAHSGDLMRHRIDASCLSSPPHALTSCASSRALSAVLRRAGRRITLNR